MSPTIDARSVNPIGYHRIDGGRLAIVGSIDPSRNGFDEMVGLMRELRASIEWDVLDSAGDGAGVSWPDGVSVVDIRRESLVESIARLREYAGVVDFQALHVGVAERAQWLVSLAAAGVPVVVADMRDDIADLLGGELVEALAATSVEGLSDTETRDRSSVTARRAALRTHSQGVQWTASPDRSVISPEGLPRVSVVTAMHRREFLSRAVSQVNRQTYPNRELVFVLHGDRFDGVDDDEVAALVTGDVLVLRAAGSLSLGEVLNLGAEASTGVLVTKMDDDDWYSAEHVWDLVLAMEYSGAALVGKAAEFVYLEELDITLRRYMDASEMNSTAIAGGALMIRRDTLREIGGWRPVQLGEDRGLIADVLEHGLTTYRTQPHGYVLNRHGRGHTWVTSVDYFLNQSGPQWRGLNLGAALVMPVDETSVRLSKD